MDEITAEMDRIMEIHRAMYLRWDRDCTKHEIMISRVPESEREFWTTPTSKLFSLPPLFAVCVGHVSHASFRGMEMSPVSNWHSAPTLLDALRAMRADLIESARKMAADDSKRAAETKDWFSGVLRIAERP